MKKILIVDDQNLYLKSLEIALRSKYEVMLASNYDEALDKLTLNNRKPDIAILDIRLDENDNTNIDGLKLLEWIKMNALEISCFVMSAYQEFNYAEQSLNLGAKHFFKKPIDIISMIGILDEKSK